MNLKSKKKYSAPALARGLEILKILENEELSLERISNMLEVPKSSALRMLQTLEAMNYVERISEKRLFRSLLRLIPNEGQSINTKIISSELEKLSITTGHTSEWYILNSEGPTISDRFNSENEGIQIRAKIGFVRKLSGELDAVAKTALAFSEGKADPESEEKNWVYCSGKKRYISTNEYNEYLADTKRNFSAFDREYNTNGIRRYAVPVRNWKKNIMGILALAEYFTPLADRYIDKNINNLKKSAENIEKQIL